MLLEKRILILFTLIILLLQNDTAFAERTPSPTLKYFQIQEEERKEKLKEQEIEVEEPKSIWEYTKELNDEEKVKNGIIDNILHLLARNLFTTDYSFLSNSRIMKVYNFLLKLAVSLLILLFTLMGIKTMLGQKFDWSNLIKKLFICAVISVAITTIVKYIIMFNNALNRAIIKSTVGEVKLYDIITKIDGSILFIIFTVVFIILAIRLLIYYYIRKFEILFLVCITPIVWFMWVGGNRSIIETWWKELCTVIFTQTIHVIQLCIFTLIINTNPTSFLDSLERLGLTIGAFLLMLKTPNWLQQYVHQTPDVTGVIKQAIDIVTFGRERKLVGKIISSTKGGKK